MPEDLVEQKKMVVMKQEYTQTMLNQIAWWKSNFPDEQIKTIYIWWGTPFQLGKENLIHVIETIFSTRDCEQLEELSIELNPDPIDETLLFVEEITKRREHLFRLRFSFGIQSFANTVLQASKRAYTYEQLPDFLRKLQKIKWAHVVYNLDFIAFGDTSIAFWSWMHHTDTHDYDSEGLFLPWWIEQREFFEKLVQSYTFDGFSVYTLELFPGSDRYNAQKHTQENKTSEAKETVYDEFDRIASLLQDTGYERYELSNFALPGKRSLHNMVYRSMGSYLGLGINASSMLRVDDAKQIDELSAVLDKQTQWVRFKAPEHWKEINAWVCIDTKSIQVLDERQFLIDELLLKLRTDQRIIQRERYQMILEPKRKEILEQRKEQWIIEHDDHLWWQMSDIWFDLYNSVVTDLIQL